MAFLFSIQDFDRTIDSPYGQPVLQILVDVAGEGGGLVLFSLIISQYNVPQSFSIESIANVVGYPQFASGTVDCLA